MLLPPSGHGQCCLLVEMDEVADGAETKAATKGFLTILTTRFLLVVNSLVVKGFTTYIADTRLAFHCEFSHASLELLSGHRHFCIWYMHMAFPPVYAIW